MKMPSNNQWYIYFMAFDRLKISQEFHWFGSETSMTCAVTGFDLYRPTTIAEKLQVRIIRMQSMT